MPMRDCCLRNFLANVALLAVIGFLHGCATTAQPVSEKVTEQEVIAAVQVAKQAQESGKTAEALFHYEEILRRAPGNRAALMGSARLSLDLSRPDLAEVFFDQVLKSTPDDAEALEGRGICRFRLKRYQQAKADFARSVMISPKRWRAWNALGVLADLRWDYATAEGHYRKALDILPDYSLLLNNLGYSLMMSHKYPEAERILRTGLSYAPQDIRLRNNLGITLAWLGRYQEGYRILVGGINEAKAYNNIGYIALLKNDYPLAIDYFKKALELSPTYYVRAASNLQDAKQQLKKQAASNQKGIAHK